MKKVYLVFCGQGNLGHHKELQEVFGSREEADAYCTKENAETDEVYRNLGWHDWEEWAKEIHCYVEEKEISE